jgi:DAK2 domain fusion protein YloV
MTAAGPPKSLSGSALLGLLSASARWLEANRDQVNAINVYPVPDGDTGTNMLLTLRSAVDEAERAGQSSAGATMAAVSRGALMGARGNSGVILSQVLRGMADAMYGHDSIDVPVLVASLAAASRTAYKAVTNPAEGTILTVVREVSEALTGAEPDLDHALETAARVAAESVARTPTLLPVLAEAGVVDAGGEGFRVILEGMLKHLRGEEVEAAAAGVGTVESDWLSTLEARHAMEESPYGYCTEVLVEGMNLDVEGVRTRMRALGDSVLVVGDDRMVRVHVHTDDPGAVLTTGTTSGALIQVKVDNINRQAEQFVERHTGTPESTGGEEPAISEDQTVSCVAVASGEGLRRVFLEECGCTRVVSGGPTMNPSTRDILEAVDSCPTQDVIVLPNDKNIIMASEQAVPLTSKNLRVVPSRSIPQGVAALLAASPEDDLEEATRAMSEAVGTVTTIEVTRAVRSTSIGGVKVQEGQIIAVVDDVLKLAAESAEEAALAALQGSRRDGASMITIYYGGETSEGQAEALAESLRAEFSGHDVVSVFGGQPHYDYIISLE